MSSILLSSKMNSLLIFLNKTDSKLDSNFTKSIRNSFELGSNLKNLKIIQSQSVESIQRDIYEKCSKFISI